MRNPFKKLDLTEVVAFLEINIDKLDNEVAEKIMAILIKSQANKILHYRIPDANL